MFPSGIMAQQAALRVWCDRAGSTAGRDPRALPPAAARGRRAAAAARLPVRARLDRPRPPDRRRPRPARGRPGRRTPGAAAARRRLPAARLGRPGRADDEGPRARGRRAHRRRADLGEPAVLRPAARRDRGARRLVYVSFYKGLGGLAGACLAADEDVVDEARRWRKRMGGTLFHLTPYAVLALAGLREHLPRMGEYVAWARALAERLVAAGVRVNPDPPQTNTFEVFAEGEADAINERAIAFMERTGVQPCGVWRAASVPGTGIVRAGRSRCRTAPRPRRGIHVDDGDHRALSELPIAQALPAMQAARDAHLEPGEPPPSRAARVELRLRPAGGARPRPGRGARPRRRGRRVGLGRVRRLDGAVRRPGRTRRR